MIFVTYRCGCREEGAYVRLGGRCPAHGATAKSVFSASEKALGIVYGERYQKPVFPNLFYPSLD